MNETWSLRAVLAPIVTDYLALKRALGRAYLVEERVLRSLNAFLSQSGSDLTSQSFIRWCLTDEHLSSGVRRNRMRIVRNLCLYRRRRESTCFVPDPSQFPPLHQPVQPHIFTEVEVVKLLELSDTLAPTPLSPLRRETYRVAIVLLYTTGLRRGELVRLRVGNYDSGEQTLLVRESKFHKSRLLPLSVDGYQQVGAYLEQRRALGAVSPDSPLLWHRGQGGKGYTGGGFAEGMRALFRAARIRTAAGQLPRVHDFRHSFAVTALLRWYRLGVDVQAKLPFLAAYMGHVSVISTEYYLHFVNDLAAAASGRFARRCAKLVTVAPSIQGRSS